MATNLHDSYKSKRFFVIILPSSFNFYLFDLHIHVSGYSPVISLKHEGQIDIMMAENNWSTYWTSSWNYKVIHDLNPPTLDGQTERQNDKPVGAVHLPSLLSQLSCLGLSMVPLSGTVAGNNRWTLLNK